MIKNIFLHFHLINKHRFKVFKLCVKAGIPFRGLVHDLSKYTPVEFIESVKYYSGDRSPINNSKRVNGYSKAWLHHKNHNKHHFDYWYDVQGPMKATIIPYKYTVEMICDNIAAGMTYNKDNWDIKEPLDYYLKSGKSKYINPKIDKVLIDTYTMLAKEGISSTINPKTLKKIYNKNVGDINDKKN